MRIANSRSAVKRYVLRRNPVDHYLDPTLPDDPGRVHVVLYEPNLNHHQTQGKYRPRRDRTKHSPATITGVQYLEYDWDAEEAACGAGVRVIFPMPFDTNEHNACRRCVELAILRQTNPPEYRRIRAEHEARRREEWNVEADLEEFYERQRADLRAKDRRHGS